MLNKNRITLMSILTVLLIALIGCSEDSSNPTETSIQGVDNYDDMDFTKSYGGLTISDEYEAFNDETLQEMMYAEDGEEHDDEYESDSDIVDLIGQGDLPGDPNDPARPRFTFLRLRWGMVRGPADSLNVPEPPCDVLDWTGEIHTDRGIVLVKRVIRFERPSDHLVFPRLNRRTVAFTSHTACHFDGLLLQIIERPQDYGTENEEPNRLHINTGPFQGVYEMEALVGLNEVTEIDNNGNLMQLNGFNLSDVAYCPKGFLSGRFRQVGNDDGTPPLDASEPGTQIGRIAGMYMDLTGRISGFMRGGYGIDVDGNRVLHAKYIDRRGNFRGLITGTWEASDDDRDMSSFEGRWISTSGHVEGILGGDAHSVADYPGGFYAGRWTQICDDEAEDQVY
ncbi:MAG: hypothetical protein GY780_08480 [bacterium]|nr:hypothetical protein [bacterium]